MLKIDFVSDVVCPWCAIGLSALDSALRELAPELQAQLRVQPFELNPQMPAEGEEIVAHLQRKYGITAEQIATNSEAIRQRGAAVGFEFGVGKRTHIVNTFDAHRLLHWAGEQGGEAQLQLKRALLAAYHGQGRLPNDPAVLLDCAVQAGLDREAAAAVLADAGRFADEVRAAEAFYQRAGISAVPAVVVNDAYLISGGQPVEVYLQALRQIAAEAGQTPA